MSTQAKDIVKDFYNSDLLNDETVMSRFFHPEIELLWNSTEGLSILHYKELEETINEVKRNYADLRIVVSHLLQDENFVTVRYKYYIKTIENNDEELPIAHFIAIWEIKEGKLYKGHQVSQPAMDTDETNGSYHKVKV